MVSFFSGDLGTDNAIPEFASHSPETIALRGLRAI